MLVFIELSALTAPNDPFNCLVSQRVGWRGGEEGGRAKEEPQGTCSSESDTCRAMRSFMGELVRLRIDQCGIARLSHRAGLHTVVTGRNVPREGPTVVDPQNRREANADWRFGSAGVLSRKMSKLSSPGGTDRLHCPRSVPRIWMSFSEGGEETSPSKNWLTGSETQPAAELSGFCRGLVLGQTRVFTGGTSEMGEWSHQLSGMVTRDVEQLASRQRDRPRPLPIMIGLISST